MTPQRIKLTLLVGGLVVSGVVLLASTQLWFHLQLVGGKALDVLGTVAAPALSVLALTGLVLVAALSIAGPFFRVVLGILGSLLGATVVLSSVLAIVGPVSAASALITKATGISGADSIASLVTTATATPWPFVATVAGALIVLVGIAVVATSHRWPGSSRKYSATRFEDVAAERDSVTDWDALSDGGDPTAR